MRRILTIWLLLVALGLPLQATARGSWHCPDGTPCVVGPEGLYQCAGGACRMACCVAQGEPSRGGCRSVCRHGALPGVGAEAPHPPGGSPAIDCVCQFTPASRLVAAAMVPALAQLLAAENVVSLVPVGQPLAAERPGVGYVPVSDPSPPSSPGLPPTGSRAPPSV